MRTVRRSLQRLGWPVAEMTERQLKQELYRRWFAQQQDDMDEEGPISVASAKGIFVSMASNGNLDALCWSQGDAIPVEDVVDEYDEAVFIRETADGPRPFPERRRSKREPARELVRWRAVYGGPENATGWLVDRSAEGLAFIAQTDEAPLTNAEILPSIHTRSAGVIDLGPATVVRTEPLNPELTLVCVQLVP